VKVTQPYILGPTPPVVDNEVMRFDGTLADKAQGSGAPLDDSEILKLDAATGALVVGNAQHTFVLSTITLTPGAVLWTDLGTRPNLVMGRVSTSQTGAPTFNFARSHGVAIGSEGAVNNGDALGILSALGHDGTDYAAGGQIDIVVDEADSGTAAVGANQMGSMIRFLNSRRTTQTPAISWRIRHNGALQCNTLTLVAMANAMAGALEYDGKVLYFSPEAGARGVVGAKYIICPTGANVLTATTPEQALFDDVGAGTLTLPTGTYLWHALASFVTMEAAAATNLAFDILGAGTATVTALWMADGGENAINVAGANSMSMSNQAQSPAAVVVGGATANLQLRKMGMFRITIAGTIIPSVTLGTAGGTPRRTADSFFVCELVGSSTVQSVGPWS